MTASSERVREGQPMLRWLWRPATVLLALALTEPLGAQESYTLEHLLAIGRERNPSLQALRAEAAARAAERSDAGRFLNPELGYESGSADPFQGNDTRSVGGVTVRQVLENPLARHQRLGALSALARAGEEELRAGALGVDYEIRMHFYRILYLQELVGLARLNEEALARNRDLMETRARVGEVKELEAIRLRVEHLRARNEAEAAEMELDQYRRHLNTFLGNVLPEDFGLDGELRADAGEPQLGEVVRTLLPDHPLLREAALEREAAERMREGSRVAWIPDPVFSGSARREMDGDIRSFGIGVTLPLWNQSRGALERDRQRALKARHTEEALRLELEAQLMIHLNHLRLNRQTLQLFQEGLLEEAEASMKIAETSYREGEISLVEYLDARRTYHSIQIEYFQALFEWNVEAAALERAAGGGIL